MRYLVLVCCLAVFSGCAEDSVEPTGAETALKKLQEKYDELVKEKIDDSVEWATDDLENIGDWEYEVASVSFLSAENLATELNEFGDEKWELIWMEKSADGYMIVLKRPAVSYISRIPLSQLGRFVPE